MKKLSSAALALITAAAATGCTSEATPRPDSATFSQLTDRVSDGLLHNPVLQRLVDLQTNRDVQGVSNHLRHSDPLVRARAAFAAASLHADELTPTLVDLLSDPDPRVRSDAAFALGQTADSSASSQLVAALDREHEIVARSRIIEAIGKTGTEDALAHLISMSSTQTMEAEVALAIARFGLRDIHSEESVEWVAKRLMSSDSRLRSNAAFYFGITPTSRPWALHAAYVRDAFEDYALDDPAAMHLALALGRFHGADGSMMLSRLANATDWRVRANTAAGLAPLSSDTRVLDGLLNALDDDNHHVAAEAAASIGWSEVLEDEHLIRIETWIDNHPDNQSAIVNLLSVLANQGRSDFVLDFVRDVVKEERAGLANLLPAVALVEEDAAFSILAGLTQSNDRRLSSSAMESLISRWQLWRGSVDGVDRFHSAFADALENANASTVLIAASALVDGDFAELGTLDLVDGAYMRLASEDPNAAIALLNVLATTNDEQYATIVSRGNQHENAMVRRASANAFGALTGKNLAVENWFETRDAGLDWAELGSLGALPLLQLETNRGTVTIELFTEQAPAAVQAIATRVKHGLYDGTDFHRIIPNFIVQGGEIVAGSQQESLPGLAKTENTRVSFKTGVLGLANMGRDTEGSQFFVTQSMQPQLDGSFTSVGHVVDGMQVIDEMRPGDWIVSAKMLPDPATS